MTSRHLLSFESEPPAVAGGHLTQIKLRIYARAHPLPQVVLTVGARGETRTRDTGFAIQRLSRLATRAKIGGLIQPTVRFQMFLERKERFELSKQVWKTRMLPATSLPLAAQAECLRCYWRRLWVARACGCGVRSVGRSNLQPALFWNPR